MASLNRAPAMGRGWDVSICFGSPSSGEVWFAMHVLSPARFGRIAILYRKETSNIASWLVHSYCKLYCYRSTVKPGTLIALTWSCRHKTSSHSTTVYNGFGGKLKGDMTEYFISSRRSIAWHINGILSNIINTNIDHVGLSQACTMASWMIWWRSCTMAHDGYLLYFTYMRCI